MGVNKKSRRISSATIYNPPPDKPTYPKKPSPRPKDSKEKLPVLDGGDSFVGKKVNDYWWERSESGEVELHVLVGDKNEHFMCYNMFQLTSSDGSVYSEDAIKDIIQSRLRDRAEIKDKEGDSNE